MLVTSDREWERQDVTLIICPKENLTGPQTGARTESCLVRGNICVHPCVEDRFDGMWSVTHFSSGRRYVVVKDSEEAMKVASELERRLGDLVNEPVNIVIQRCPDEVKLWLKECQATGRCV